ncbi:MAG TPA: ACT domain-containing protein [Vicinamibacterales bacterium]|nr:ACT domain-containing protein [Vicinamibacterales bacterium]
MVRSELTLRLPNSPGALARVCDVLAAERVNILALMLEPAGVLRLVVDNPVHAAGVLRERHYEVSEREALVVEVPNEPGSFAAVGRLLAGAGINLDYAYATARDDQASAIVVVGVPDALRASAAAGL